MVCKPTKDDRAGPIRSPLLPDRMTDGIFVCDVFDAAPKGDMASMEHPIFSISTKPDLKRRRYENGTNFVEVLPSDRGIATVHDRDILIFCISQVMVAVNEGRRVERVMRFKAFDLLTATNRPTGGESYARLKEALERLAGTRIATNIITGGEETFDNFGLIDRFRIVRKTRDGRMRDVEVTLSDWVYNAIRHQEVLTLSRDYFRLRKPLERRLYEIARKHCGVQPSWRIGLAKLKDKCGSRSTDKEFRRLLSKIVEENDAHAHIPDYDIVVEDALVVFRSRGSVPCPVEHDLPPLDADALDQGRREAPGWDIHVIEGEWRGWCAKEDILPRRPEAHFVKFCQSWFERRGRP